MNLKRKVGYFFPKDKSEFDYDNFSLYFMKEVKRNKHNYTEAVEGFVKNLYHMDNDNYDLWINPLKRVDYETVVEYIDYLIPLSQDEDNYPLEQTIIEIFQKEKSIICREVSEIRTRIYNSKNKQKVIEDVNKMIDGFGKEDSETTSRMVNKFTDSFKDIENPILKQCISDRKNRLELELFKEIRGLLAKIKLDNDRYEQTYFDDALVRYAKRYRR